MKVIGIIGAVISVISVIIGIIIAVLRIVTIYNKATMFRNMKLGEKLFLRIIDKQMYENLRDSYLFIVGLPFLGDTL